MRSARNPDAFKEIESALTILEDKKSFLFKERGKQQVGLEDHSLEFDDMALMCDVTGVFMV
jgi:hypothetical protein